MHSHHWDEAWQLFNCATTQHSHLKTGIKGSYMQETEGESLTRHNRLSLDTEVSNSAVKLHYLLMPMNRQNFSSTCHLKLCGSWIGLSH